MAVRHIIQTKILLDLAYGGQLKYSDLMQKDIENDLFNYHLQYLVKNGLVNKTANKYEISQKGVEAILLTDSRGKEYSGIRSSVIVHVINKKGTEPKILVQKRNRKPYIGEEGAGISGKINRGELVEAAAQRKLLEECCLKGKCRFLGTMRKMRKQKDGKIDDAFFYVCVCEKFSGELKSTEFGINKWESFDYALNIQKGIKSSAEYDIQILKQIVKGDKSNFFYEELINVDSF